MDDQDRRFLKECEETFDAISRKYFAADAAGKALLWPQIEMATENWLKARLKLLKEGTLATDADLDAIRRLKADVEHAADTQLLVIAIAKLIVLLAQFA